MNNEFKKIKTQDTTHYVLENASSGGTSSGSVASVSTALGGVRKRGDNLLAQEAGKDKVPATTPRNFVAKNAKTSGAGAHKDKKKAAKQGDAKHKNKDMDMAEGLQARLAELKAKVAEAYGRYDRRDAYQRDYDHSVAGMGKHQSQAYQDDGGANDERHDLDPTDWYVVKDGKMFAVSVYPGQEQQATAKGFSRTRDEAKAKASGVAEGDNAEYDDEAGMADNNLETLKRAVEGLDNLIGAGDNLPEWCQEKIAVAKSMLVAVWDYMQSEENSQTEGLEEGSSDYVGNAIEDLRMSKPGLDRESFLDELYSYLDAQYGKQAADAAMAHEDDAEFDDWYDLYSDMAESAPKGWEGTVKAMKKHKDIDNPFALANWMKNKGMKSHKEESVDPYFESLTSNLDQLKKK